MPGWRDEISRRADGTDALRASLRMRMKQAVILAEKRAEVAEFGGVAEFAVDESEGGMKGGGLAVAELGAVVGDDDKLGEGCGVPGLAVNVGRRRLP